MKLPQISIENHVFAWMLMLGLLVFGGIAFSRMGVSQLPNVDFPIVSINVTLAGAAPEVMELNVVDPIEAALTSVQGIQSMSSTARTGTASISVEFSLKKDINVAVQEIQSALARAQKSLPTDVDPPTVSKSNPEDQPIIWLAATSETLSSRELMTLVRDQIKDRFSTVEGVGEVTLGGYVEPNLRVWLSKEALTRYQLTAADVISTIQTEHSELPGGRVETTDREFNIRTMGEAPTVDDFGRITISRRGGGLNYLPIPLKNVAKVEEGLADVRSLSRSAGVTSVGLGIRKQPGSNAVEVAHSIKERVAELKKQLPKGVDLNVRFDTTQFIEESVGELNFTLIFSALLTAVVCWMFLGSWSATMNVVLAIPTSVVGTFIVLYAFGFTLNAFTLLGLSLAIGIVVDDAIMVLENIVRHKEMGKDRRTAALDGAVEITMAALAATVAIIAIFLPVAFMEGIIGRYFLEFGVTLTVAVALSLLEALTLTPMRCSQFLTVEPRTSRLGKAVDKGFELCSNVYSAMIPWVLKHRLLTIVAATLVFAATLFIGSFIKKEFVPAQDQGRLMVRIQTPVGSSLAFTDAKLKELENYFSKRPEVEGYFSSVGGFGGAGQVNTGMVFLTLKPAKQRKMTAQELAVDFRKGLKDVKDIKLGIQDPSLSGLSARRGYPVEFTIRGGDWKKLAELSQQVMKKMEESGAMTDVDSNYLVGMPEIQVIPDRDKARERGVDVATISQTINVMMAGAVAGKYSSNGKRFDVRVGLPPDARDSEQVIRDLRVRNNRGELIPVSDVVTLKKQDSLQSISREDRQRAISVYANVSPKSSQGEAIEIVNKITTETLPAGYYASISGSAKTFKEAFQSLIFALVLGILVSYMVLASQFNSFIHPVTILMALPFSISGAFLALYLGGQTLNVYSMIGLILLMGIVKKNSILLVEFANHFRDQGKSANEALIEACPVRLRPILMTSIATIAGAVPPALAIGPGAETRIPMALAVIGGVFLSTILTLLVVPAVYSLLDRFDHRSKV